MAVDEFILRKNYDIPYYSCRALENISWLRQGFSTRYGGAAGPVANPTARDSLNLHPTTWDTPARVVDNRRRWLRTLQIQDLPLVSLRQIHSNRIHVVTRAADFIEPPEGDALITNVENVALAVRTADCFPILLADPLRRAVGAVHSGWRGTLAGILPRAIAEMRRCYGSDPAQLLVARGPAIRECCFEVGADVARLFVDAYPTVAPPLPFPGRPAKYLLNLAAILGEQMRQAHVAPAHQYDIAVCTCCGARDFFSWRAEGAAAGRMMAVIAIVS